MKTIFNSSEKFNDLIFENKNKVYGAYALRKSYKDNLSLALFFTVSFFALVLFLAMFFGKGIDKLPSIGGNIIVELPFGKLIDIPKPPDIVKPKVNTVKPPEAPKTESGQMQASDNDKDVVDKTNEQFNVSATPNNKGTDSASTDGIAIPEDKKEDPNEVVKIPDTMPEFDDLQKFIRDNLVYPAIAKDNGTQGRVYISFIVEPDGSVSDIKALTKIGDGCEQEAMRVVKMMKKWKPGVFKGKARRVPATLPIWFKLK